MIQVQDHYEPSGAIRASGQFYVIMGWMVRRSAVLPVDSCCNETGHFGAVKHRRGRNDNMVP